MSRWKTWEWPWKTWRKSSVFMLSSVTKFEDSRNRREGLQCFGEFSFNCIGNRGPCSVRKRRQSFTCWMLWKAWQGLKATQEKRKRRGNCSWQSWCQALLNEEKEWNGHKSWREGWFCQIVISLHSKELEKMLTTGGIWQPSKASSLLSIFFFFFFGLSISYNW